MPWEAVTDPNELAVAEAELAGGGENGKTKGDSAALDSVIGQINRVDELYQKNIKGNPASRLFGLTEMFNTPTNAQFDSAGAALGDQGMAAFRIPGSGTQTEGDAERFVKANQPLASDYDTAIEEKIRALKARVDATRKARGLPPAAWGTATPPAANGFRVIRKVPR